MPDQTGSQKTSPLGDDLLRGAKAIAEELGCKPRAVYHLAEFGQLPIWHEPGIGLVARRSSLEAHFARHERQSVRKEPS